ncbi:helix-turn-helix transcriptional regulator [Achromobacter pestifer]|uniref:Helix-turn-helix transcriptional regulator n=1 Tax=Achromobacter pestifer TaxID=1353889 RepID=A0A7D4DXZ3_9BURK|nr:helix-turn-helix domain-containing protein [Achromobacter pestifer]QKH36125.1 helix-turn-helix transcriptional regulator [Achromobacter pestifer]
MKKMTTLSPAGDVFDASCPSRRALELIAGKWVPLILPALEHGPLRNNELLRRLDGISQKVMTQTLRELERHGLVLREDLGTVPPHVSYRLSELGQSLNVALIALDRWAETHHAALDAAARRHDASQSRRGVSAPRA